MESNLLDLIIGTILFIWALVKLGQIADNTAQIRRDISRYVRRSETSEDRVQDEAMEAEWSRMSNCLGLIIVLVAVGIVAWMVTR